MTIDEIPDTPVITAWRRNANYGGCTRLCDEINECLRQTPREIPDHIPPIVVELDSLFKLNTLPKGSTLYRGCLKCTIEPALSDGEMIYPAFMSTSDSAVNAQIFLDHQNADDSPVMLQLVLQESIPVIDAQSRIFDGIGEGEFVLPRGLKLTFNGLRDGNKYELAVSEA